VERQDAEARANRDARERAEALWESLRANDGLRRIARTPLVLSLITLVHHCRRANLPKGRAKLYERCLDILLDEWDRQDKGLDIVGPSYNDRLEVLKTVANHFLRGDLLEADADELETLIAPLVSTLTTPMPASDLVALICERSGILVEKALGRYGFAHRALQDYLAAGYLVEHEEYDALQAHAGEEHWREVLLIAVGKAPTERANLLLRALLQTGDLAGLEMAGWCLAEDIQVKADLRGQVQEALLRALPTTEQPGPFGRLVSALMAADLTAARGWMEDALRGRDRDVQQRVLNLAPTLGPVYGQSLVPLLCGIAGDVSGCETRLRVRALCVLPAIAQPGNERVFQAARVYRESDEEEARHAGTWCWCALGRYEELGLARVPAGPFLMGSADTDPAAGDAEKPQHTVYLPTYYIGRTPVTVGEYRAYVEESGITPVDADCLDGHPDWPVAWITWHEALAYARRRGLTLPSEAEWEKAARGEDGRLYPWGNVWRPDALCWGGGRSRGLVGTVLRALPGWWGRRRMDGRAAVGHFSPMGDSPYGCVDMAGNVWEWTRSLDAKYPYEAGDGRENLQNEGSRVLRGGSWYVGGPWFFRAAYRGGVGPRGRLDLLGFRCVVRSPGP
jgi:formylglycine-generating enzyme required for sulfatase activity